MKFKEVSYSVAQTISANYQSYKIQIGTIVEVDNGTPGIAYKTAKIFVDKKLKEEIEAIKEII